MCLPIPGPGIMLCRSLVAQSCPTLCDPVDCSPPGSSVPGILQARMLERVAISFPRGSSRPRDQTHICCTAGRFLTTELLIHKTQIISGHLLGPLTHHSCYQARGQEGGPLLSSQRLRPIMTGGGVMAGGGEEYLANRPLHRENRGCHRGERGRSSQGS